MIQYTPYCAEIRSTGKVLVIMKLRHCDFRGVSQANADGPVTIRVDQFGGVTESRTTASDRIFARRDPGSAGNDSQEKVEVYGKAKITSCSES